MRSNNRAESFTRRFELFAIGWLAFGGKSYRSALEEVRRSGIKATINERAWIGRDDWWQLAAAYVAAMQP